MPSPRQWLLISLVQSLGAGLLFDTKDVSFCPWNPAADLQPITVCELRSVGNASHGPQSDNAGAHQARHECIGDYCFFWKPGFSGGQGLVAVTTKANLKWLEMLQDDAAHQPSSDGLGSFRLETLPGKGLGMVADKKLQRGDSLMLQRPAILAHKKVMTELDEGERNRLLDKTVSLLPAETQKLFFAQMGHFGGHRASDILLTNGFQVHIGGGDDPHHYGNYPKVSRYNHDCRPNVAYYIDEKLVHHSTVVRTIQPDEELTITYLDPFQPWAARQERTVASWGFLCRCQQCSLSPEKSQESDARLERLEKLEAKLEDPSERVTMGMVRRYMNLHEDERLDVKLAGALTVAAMNANMLGHEEAAKEYARRAVEAGLIEGGETPDVIEMRKMMEHAKEHFTWNGRVE